MLHFKNSQDPYSSKNITFVQGKSFIRMNTRGNSPEARCGYSASFDTGDVTSSN